MRTYTLASHHYTLHQRITSMVLAVALALSAGIIYRAFADGVDIAIIGDSRAFDMAQWLKLNGVKDEYLDVSVDDLDASIGDYDYKYNNQGNVAFKSNSQKVFNATYTGRESGTASDCNAILTASSSHSGESFYVNAYDSANISTSVVQNQLSSDNLKKINEGGTVYLYYGSAYSVCNTNGVCDPSDYIDTVSTIAKSHTNINFVIVSATYIDEDRVGGGTQSSVPSAYKNSSYTNDAIDTFNNALQSAVLSAKASGTSNIAYVDVNTSAFQASLASNCYNADGVRYLRDTSVTCADGGNGHLEPTLYYYVWNAMQGYSSSMDSSDFVFDGWDNEDNQTYAWYVYDLTDWNEISGLEFEAAGSVATANVPDSYRSSVETAITKGISNSRMVPYSDKSKYKELLIAISYTFSKDAGDNEYQYDICWYHTYVEPQFKCLNETEAYSIEDQAAYNEEIANGYSLKENSAQDLFERLVTLERKYYSLYSKKNSIYRPDNVMKVILQSLIYGEDYMVACGGVYDKNDAQSFYSANINTADTYIGLRESPEFNDFAEKVMDYYNAMEGFKDFENIG